MFDHQAGEFLESELMLMGASESFYFLCSYLPIADVEAPKLNRAVQGW